MTRIASILAASCLSMLALAPGMAAGAPVTMKLVAKTEADMRPEFAAGYGYVAWIDKARPGRRRVVVRRPDGTTRRRWIPGWIRLDIRRQKDLSTGRVVTRLVTIRRKVTGSETSTLRSPRTLRRLATVWAAASRTGTIDGGSSVELVAEPDPSVPQDPWWMPPSRCTFTISGTLAAVPSLTDCGGGGAVLRGPLLAVNSWLPSGTSSNRDKGQINASTLSIFSTDHPQLGWRRLATATSGYPGRFGLQSFCVSDRGVALLEGNAWDVDDPEPGTPWASWTLRWVPADPAEPGWTGTVPQLDRMIESTSFDVRLACTGDAIYATYTPPGRGTSAGIPRVVRITAPRGADARP